MEQQAAGWLLPICNSPAATRYSAELLKFFARNLYPLLRSPIIIVVGIMFITISIIVLGIYVMFMIIVYRLKPGSFSSSILRAYETLVLLQG